MIFSRPSTDEDRELDERSYLAKAQARFRDEIKAADGQWAIAKDLDEALAKLESWGAIKPPDETEDKS